MGPNDGCHHLGHPVGHGPPSSRSLAAAITLASSGHGRGAGAGSSFIVVVIVVLLSLSVSTPISPCEQWLAGWVVVLCWGGSYRGASGWTTLS
jgi:hypothetical protein